MVQNRARRKLDSNRITAGPKTMKTLAGANIPKVNVPKRYITMNSVKINTPFVMGDNLALIR